MNYGFHRKLEKRGFSLVENLISLTAIALIIPTSLALLSQGVHFKTKAKLERACQEIASHVFSELPSAWNNNPSFLFPSPLSFPLLSSTTELSIRFSEGLQLWQEGGDNATEPTWKVINPDAIHADSPELASSYIATVFLDDLPDPDYRLSLVRRFSVRVSFPAGMPADKRTSYTYSRLFRDPT